MSQVPPPAPGWYADPHDPSRLRWWDGHGWTEHRVAHPTAPTGSPAGLRKVGDFLSAAFSSPFRAWRPLLTLTAVVGVPLAVAVILADAQLGFTDWIGDVLTEVEETPVGQDPDIPEWDVNAASATIWVATLALLYGVVWVVLPLAAVRVVDASLRKQPLDLDRSAREGLRATPRAIGVALVVAFAFVAALLVLVLVTAAIPPIGVLLFLAAIPVAVWLWVRLMIVHQPLLVLEGLGLGLFARSWELTRGRFWGLLGRSALFGILVSIGSSLVTSPFQFAGQVDQGFAVLLSLTLGAVANAASRVVQVGGPLVLYQDLTEGPPEPESSIVWGAGPSEPPPPPPSI